MRFRSYPRYKASGVEWFGEVPEHWGVGRVSGLFRIRSGGTPNTDIAHYWEGDIPWVSAKDMKSLRIVDTEDHISLRAVAESATSILPRGTVLIVARSGILKHTLPVAVADRQVAINQDIKGLLPDSERIDGLFFTYWIQGNQRPLLTLWRQQGATVESLEMEKVKVAAVPLPPREEQRAIADFLDCETAMIDTLVAKKWTLIERLKEKRTALISRTVTRGLPPDAARAASLAPHPTLKSSGTDWLGDMPEHWEVMTLKRTWAVCEYGISEALSGEGPIRVLTMGNIQDGRVLLPDEGCLDEIAQNMLLKNGDLLFNRTNSLVHVGKVGMYEGTVNDSVTFASYLVRIRTNERALPAYMRFAMNTPQILEFARALALPSINQANLNPTRYGQIPISLPPTFEQAAIAEYLDRETAKIDKMVAKVETAVERLQEYRTALITAAVTGKIDVRRQTVDNALEPATAS